MTDSGAILTLEPLLDAVREGLEADGWELSGLQKTTSYEFEGRWAGDSSRSAYLFFHSDQVPEWVSLDVFLDETSRGLRGNLALVVDGPTLSEVQNPGAVMARLASVIGRTLPKGYRTPMTLRYRMQDLTQDPTDSDTEFRFKLYIPGKALRAGRSAVAALATSAASAFRGILRAPELEHLLLTPE